jgi:hypothetical protein
MFFWHVPAPNEALLISGSKRHNEATQFRIVTGHGCFVTPVKQKARVLSLALREAEIVEECITNQGIRLNIRAVAAFKIGDDQASIANAARRFLSEQDRMEVLVGRVFGTSPGSPRRRRPSASGPSPRPRPRRTRLGPPRCARATRSSSRPTASSRSCPPWSMRPPAAWPDPTSRSSTAPRGSTRSWPA